MDKRRYRFDKEQQAVIEEMMGVFFTNSWRDDRDCWEDYDYSYFLYNVMQEVYELDNTTALNSIFWACGKFERISGNDAKYSEGYKHTIFKWEGKAYRLNFYDGPSSTWYGPLLDYSVKGYKERLKKIDNEYAASRYMLAEEFFSVGMIASVEEQ